MLRLVEDTLPIPEVARRLAQDMRPSATPTELRDLAAAKQVEIERAWWLRELMPLGEWQLQMLRSMHALCGAGILFFTGEEPGPESAEWLETTDPAHGGRVSIVIDDRPRVPLPSADRDSWTADACGDAFKALATAWPLPPSTRYALVAPAMRRIALPRDEFLDWATRRYGHCPRFWGDPVERPVSESPRPAITPVDPTPSWLPPAPPQASKVEQTALAMTASTAESSLPASPGKHCRRARKSKSAFDEPGDLLDAAITKMWEAGEPGRYGNISWGEFATKVIDRAGLKDKRGTSDKTIKRRVNRLLAAGRICRSDK
jgi:hypothetical protein